MVAVIEDLAVAPEEPIDAATKTALGGADSPAQSLLVTALHDDMNMVVFQIEMNDSKIGAVTQRDLTSEWLDERRGS